MKENSEDDSQQFKSEQLELAEISETTETSENKQEINNNSINIQEKNVKEESLIVSNKETDGN